MLRNTKIEKEESGQEGDKVLSFGCSDLSFHHWGGEGPGQLHKGCFDIWQGGGD